ncbi:tetratricopeptide repeat protein [Niabella sp. CC-SYL272]|uniref:tetratricopeptide repeat protein n=1 Tax=Niabella agricola TaxID=2891571 RepID=UPI001F2190C0|nr:tetratricopeptide repeat protein [Niabella agricola]MCF3111538.1 tetratricopeptide repeat protein [Niabella agricola]
MTKIIEDPLKMKKPKSLIIAGAALLVLLVLAYANHFDNDFHFDDSHTIQENVAIRKLGNIPEFFTNPDMFSASSNHRGLRPLVTTSLAIDYWLGGGLHPFMFQLSTFLWHIGLCIMLFFMYRRLIGKVNTHKWVPFIALMGAGWFGLHTVVAETINYIISRSDVQSTFFIVASFLTYVAYPEKRKYGLYILLAVLGVFAKETVPVLPILLFFYLLLFENGFSLYDLFRRSNIKKVLACIWSLLPLIVVVAGVQLYTLSRMSQASASHGMSNPLGYNLLTQTYVWLHYFRSFFLPFDLSADTDLGVITNPLDWRIIAGILFVTTLIVTIFKTSRRSETRPIAFGLIWFAASLLPTSLVPFAEVMNDHRMYFAFVGLTLSVVTTLGLLVIKREAYFTRNKHYRFLIVAAFLVIAVNAFGVYKRNQVWDNEETLWKDVTEKSPNNGRGWMNYGLTLMAKGDYKRAVAIFTKARDLNSGYSTVYVNLGIAYGGLKLHNKAIENFSTALLLAPGDDVGYSYFARYFLEQNRFEDAKNMAERALAINSRSYMAYEVLMGALQGLSRWDQLKQTAAAALQLNPEDPKALQYLQAAQQRKTVTPLPKDVTNAVSVINYINISLEQYNEGEYEACINTCKQALSLDPNNADAYNNICAAYNMLKQWDKAREACTKALQLNPGHPNAPANLKWAIEQKL